MRLFETRGIRLRRLRQVRCIACDLDGTLLTGDNTILPDVLNIIGEARTCGVRIILASGRTDAFTRKYAVEIGSTEPIISLNGCLVKDSAGNALFSTPMSDRVAVCAEEVKADTATEELSVSLFTADGILTADESPVLPRYLRSDSDEIVRVRDLRPYHASAVLLCAGGTYRAVQRLSVQLAGGFGNRLMRSMYQSRGGADLYYLEVRPMGISKATALRSVITALGIPRKETAAIGDYTNDLEMCTFAGVSAAMRNGIEELKSAADYVTRMDNNEGGVAEFLRLILEGRIRV